MDREGEVSITCPPPMFYLISLKTGLPSSTRDASPVLIWPRPLQCILHLLGYSDRCLLLSIPLYTFLYSTCSQQLVFVHPSTTAFTFYYFRGFYMLDSYRLLCYLDIMSPIYTESLNESV